MTPDEAHDEVKQTVATAVATVAGAVDGFLDTMRRYDLPTKTKDAMEQLGQATRRLSSTAAEEIKETGSELKQGSQQDGSSGQDKTKKGSGEHPRQSPGLPQSAPDLPGTEARTAEMTAGREGGRGTRTQNTGPEGTRNTMSPRPYGQPAQSNRRQTDSYAEANKDLNADRKFHADVGWDDQDVDELAAHRNDSEEDRENLPSRSVH